MCGIAGQINFNRLAADRTLLEKMAEAMSSRGPDDHGVMMQGHMGFSHRRLKVMDTTQGSAQPMFDPETGLGIVYNGAIYNYPKLRSELIEKGHKFVSHGDTEVILKAYHEWGENCLERFNGMFAFAIWNQHTKDVFLARDRLGIKPLYIHITPDGLLFASTINALLQSKEVKREINPVGLHHYMHFHSVVPAPHTIIKDIKKLPQGSYMKVGPEGVKEANSYWNLSFTNKLKFDTTEEYAKLVLAALRKSVARRLIADVPVGVLLSGGVDSSLITGLIAENGGSELNTYSIGFESLDKEKGDEFEFSDLIAKHYGTKHHKIFIPPGDVLKHLPEVVQSQSEPMVSHDNVGFYLLSREVSKTIKVVQSGQGADEIFAGYHWYPPLVEPTANVNNYAELFLDISQPEYIRAVQSPYIFENYSIDFLHDHFTIEGANTTIDRALRLDSTVMLTDDPLKRVDNMTMAWGLEARVPFLDHEVVELAARIPADQKVAHGGKHVLKEAARQVIPDAVIDRPKGYFPVPALKYLRGEFLDYVKEILHDPTTRRRNLFKPEYVQTLLQNPEDHITPLRGSKLWQIALLEQWLNLHKVEG